MPWVGLILSFVGGLVFLLPFPSWHSLVGLVTSASVLMYAGAPLSLGAFRGQVPDATRPYRLGGAWFMAPLGFIIANFIIYWSGFEVIWKLGIVMVIGYVHHRRLHGVRPAAAEAGREGVAGGELAAGLPDRHGHHLVAGPVRWRSRLRRCPINTGNIPLWWDLLILAAFSLGIYYWAMYTKLPRTEMLELVNAQSRKLTCRRRRLI